MSDNEEIESFDGKIYDCRLYCIKHDMHVTPDMWKNRLCSRCNLNKHVAIGLIKGVDF